MLKTKGSKNILSLIFLAIILFLSSFLAFYTLHEGHNWGGDFALYLNQTESIFYNSTEELLAMNTFSMENSTQMAGANPQIGPHLYPWGFPILLIPVYALFGVDLLVFKLYMLLFFLLILIVVYFSFKEKIGRRYTLLVVAILAVNPHLLSSLDNIGSDIPYAFFALLAVLIIQKIAAPLYIGRKIPAYILLGFVIFIAFLIRTNGIVLLGMLFISQALCLRSELNKNIQSFFNKNWIEILPYLTFLTCLILSKLVLSGGSGSHLEFLSRVTPGKLAYNIMYYIELPAAFFEGALFPQIVFGFSLPFLLLGLYRRFVEDNYYISYSAFTLAVFIVWPPVQGLRFIYSILPFYLYFTFVGFSYAETLFRGVMCQGYKNSKLAYAFSFYVLFTFLFTSYMVASENFDQRQTIEGPYTKEGIEMMEFISANTDSEDVIVFFKPRVLNYLTSRPSVRVTEMDEIIAGKGEYYVYYKNTDFGQVELDEFLNWFPDHVLPIFENSKFLIYPLENIRPGILRSSGISRPHQ